MNTGGLEFSNIYDQYHEKMRRYVERMVGVNDAEDVTQEVAFQKKISKLLFVMLKSMVLKLWINLVYAVHKQLSCRKKVHRNQSVFSA